MSQSTFKPFEQLSLLDPINSMPEKERLALENGWPGIFRNRILPKLAEQEHHFAPLYSDKPNSRPSTPTYLVLAFWLLKSLFNLTDEQLIWRINYGFDYQYALGTTSLPSQPINQRTLNRFRAALALYEQENGINLMERYFYDLAEQLKTELMGESRMRRMDSVMVDNGCRKLSRLQTAHTVIRNALGPLEDSNIEIDRKLKHYVEDFDENQMTYHDHRSSKEKTEEAFRDAFCLYSSYPEELRDTEEYSLLERFVSEQIDLDEKGEFLSVREGKKLTSTTMNNPADPESTVRSKAGEVHQGYVGNFVETVDLQTGRKIIDSADFQQNIYSDSQFARDEIARMAEKGNTDPMAADGAYNSIDNINLAKEHGIELLGTDLTGKETPDLYAEFQIDEENREVTCPNGRKAGRVKPKKDGSFSVSFTIRECEGCPFEKNCPLKPRKNIRSGNVSSKVIQRAKLQRMMKTEEYHQIYCFRNGVEAIPSQLRRNQDIDHLPYKGLVRKKAGYLMAIMGINIRRVIRYAQEDLKKASKADGLSCLLDIFVKIFEFSQNEVKLTKSAA